MGNCCLGSKNIGQDSNGDLQNLTSASPGVVLENALGTGSAVVQWEEHQKDLNFLVLEKMREDFHNRPDNFILNLLTISIQFYANFSKEKADIIKHIRDRELALENKLTASKRKIMYLGGLEEISGTHILYQPRDQHYMELPTPLQIYVVQENVDLFSEDQYHELQEKTTDVDGPAYRFCTEFSNMHPGYTRLRCADIIPGMTRHNTYEDIYAFLKPVDESEPDPIIDSRPLRRNSLVSSSAEEDEDHPMPQRNVVRQVSSTEFEESDDDSKPATPLPMHFLKQRRLSGVMPHAYPHAQQANLLATLKEKEQRSKLPNGDVGLPHSNMPTPRSSTERRPSGAFPKVGPEMKRLKLSSTITVDGMTMLKKKLTLVEEESEEDEHIIEEEDEKSIQETSILPKHLEEVEQKPVKEKEETVLHAHINKGCFLNRKIKIRDLNDAYGIQSKLESRTYLSSERYLECFEDDFEELATILGKEHLVEDCKLQVPAVLASELMIEDIGPKYNTEFIPTLILKEWPRCSFEWKMRERKGRHDEETQMTYKWPKDYNIQEVVQMGCNLVPLGHYNPKHPNRVMKIEWQLQFTKAEQILLRSLGHLQVRILLLVEFLVRDHLEDLPGLKTQHLRYILFWMCEHNFRDWQEDRLGNKLKAYFKTLYNCLSSENLPHYFIDKCNMMENIPERYLRQIQAAVKKVKDNLPVYLMHTIKRMRTASEFYPMLDIEKLYNIVTAKNFGIQNINPQLAQLLEDEPQNHYDLGEDVLYSDSEEEREAETKKKLHAERRKRKKQARKSKPGDDSNTRRHSTIRLDAKVQSVKDLRAGHVLQYFAEHFLAMARASNENRSYPQAYNFLLMADNMATLLDETGNNDEARSYRQHIDELKFSSRCGVEDLMGSTWSANGQQDLMLNGTSIRGSNWEMAKKERLPPPSSPPNASPIIGLERITDSKAKQGTSLFQFGLDTKTEVSKTLSYDSDSISLPNDMSEHGNENLPKEKEDTAFKSMSNESGTISWPNKEPEYNKEIKYHQEKNYTVSKAMSDESGSVSLPNNQPDHDKNITTYEEKDMVSKAKTDKSDNLSLSNSLTEHDKIVTPLQEKDDNILLFQINESESDDDECTNF